MKRHRIAAVVNVNNSPEEVAETLGISPEEYVDHGNGYAVILSPVVETPPELVASPKEGRPGKAKGKKKKAEPTPEPTPEPDADMLELEPIKGDEFIPSTPEE